MKPFSPIAHGYWRLMEWNLRPEEIARLMEDSLALGIYTLDHADIYGDYRCEAAFGKGVFTIARFGTRRCSVGQQVRYKIAIHLGT